MKNAEVPFGPAPSHQRHLHIRPFTQGREDHNRRWFNHEQEESNASPGYRCEHDKKYFHDGMLPKFLPTPPTTVRKAFHDCVSGISTGQQGLIDLILAAS
jgi:hypothetical protein